MNNMEPTSKIDGNRDNDGKFVKGNKANEKGVGGFQERPQDISRDGRPKNQESFTYWMNHFKNMPVKEFLDWPKVTPEATRSVASDLAWTRVLKARKHLDEFKEVADRTEGRSKQPIEMNTKIIQSVKVEIVENVPTS